MEDQQGMIKLETKECMAALCRKRPAGSLLLGLLDGDECSAVKYRL